MAKHTTLSFGEVFAQKPIVVHSPVAVAFRLIAASYRTCRIVNMQLALPVTAPQAIIFRSIYSLAHDSISLLNSTQEHGTF